VDKDFGKISTPLSSFLAKELSLHLSKEYNVSFMKLKDALTATPILQPPVRGEQFELMCDVSGYGIGIVWAKE